MAFVSVINPSALVLKLLIRDGAVSYLPDFREVVSYYCGCDDDQQYNKCDACTHDPTPSLLLVLLCKPLVSDRIRQQSPCILQPLVRRAYWVSTLLLELFCEPFSTSPITPAI
jgi:hypothetical protein